MPASLTVVSATNALDDLHLGIDVGGDLQSPDGGKLQAISFLSLLGIAMLF